MLNTMVQDGTREGQDVISCDGIRTVYQETLNLGSYDLTISVPATKKWNDANNKDNVRPTSIKVKLMNGNTQVATGTLNSSNGWKYTFTNLQKFDKNGNTINYTVQEETPNGYKSAIAGNATNGYTITNTALRDISVKKAWDDLDDKYGERPDSVKVFLYKDGVKTSSSAVLSKNNNWTAKFEKLERYSGDTEIQYTVKEDKDAEGYKVSSITGDMKNGYTLTNTLATIGGNVWEDREIGKETKVDGSNATEGDVPLKNIKVTLYDASTNAIATLDTSTQNMSGSKLMHRVNPTYTDEEGNYLFIGVNQNKNYYVVFEYNGQKYLPTEYLKAGATQYKSISDMISAGKYNTTAWKTTSKALETSTDRTTYNEKFGEIGSYPQNYKTSNSLGKVGTYNAVFSELDLMGYTLGENGKYSQTGKQLIDGFKYDENGDRTREYAEGEISKKIREYIDKNKTSPNETQLKSIYADIAGTNTEIWRELQFIEDCKMQASTRNKSSRETYKVSDSNYSSDTKGLLYINLGLWGRQESLLSLKKDVAFATTKINGKTEVYKYPGSKTNVGKEDDEYLTIQLRMQNYVSYYGGMYVDGIYRSDYEYRQTASTGPELDVYVTYKITVRNSSQSMTSQIKEVVDYYDNDYTYMPDLSWAMYKDKSSDDIMLQQEDYYNMMDSLKLSKIPNNKPIISEKHSKYGTTTEQDLKNNTKAVYIRGLENKKLESGESAHIYLTFKVNKDGNGRIVLDNNNNVKMNYAEINGYTTYYLDGTELPNGQRISGDATVAGIIDNYSTPGNLSAEDLKGNRPEKNFENDTDRAKGIKVAIDENAERKLNGTVWEDERNFKVSEAVIGDGVRQDNEIKIQGVTVELVEKLANGNEFVWQTAKTDANGKYEFSKFIPGNYIVRFRYGHNDETVLTNANRGANIASYNGQDFKSTVYQKDMTDGKELSDDTYYNISAADALADAFGKNVSDAKDLWDERKVTIIQMVDGQEKSQQTTLQGRTKVNEYSNGVIGNREAEILASPYANTINQEQIKELKDNTNMVAETGIIVMEGEYDRTISKQDSKNGQYALNNVDFGLTERPKAQLELDKKVSNVKVTLANGNVLFDSNKSVDNLLWKSTSGYNLEKPEGKYPDYYAERKTNDSEAHPYAYRTTINELMKKAAGLIQITMDEEIMHGAQLEVIYKLEVTNVGETDYEGQNFYYKGTEAKTISTTTVNTVIDYVPNNMQFNVNNNSGDWKIVKANDLENVVSDNVKTLASKINTIIQTNPNKDLKPGDSCKLKDLVLTQTITAQNKADDLKYENIAEIVKISNTLGRRMAYSIQGNLNPMDYENTFELDSAKAEKVVILPPFGITNYIYLGLALIVVSIIAGGIIIIKKKVI